ncbi:TonB-dependent receptor domain-containing protein [Chryseobacterium sp. RLHN22]|uniref:TonB-dependent receptor domain-containing protein n=1 Tax=Chryseobacterium sp. RLHN22 TaxID=3437885 RepID=UPI003D9B7F41
MLRIKSISAIFLFGTFSLYHSQTLSGKVTDNKGKGLANVEIVILKKDLSTAGEVLTNKQGDFLLPLPVNEYLLRVKQSSNILYERSLFIKPNGLNLGNIKVSSFQNIQEVTIKGKKGIIERKVDRMVFDVEKSVFSQGTDLLDLLSNTPLVKATDQGISIIGKGSVQIMVNDRIIQISGKDLIAYLKTLQTNDISKVEVITSPSAKYDAEGNGGLINIITKRNLKENFSGNLSTSFVKNTKESFYNNVAINYNKKAFSSSVKFRHTDYSAMIYENQDALFFDGSALNNHTDREDNSKTVGLNVDLSYKTSQRNTLGLMYDIGKTTVKYLNDNETSYFTKSRLDSVLTTNSTYRNPNTTQTLSIYNDLKIGKTGSKISFTANYFKSNPLTQLDFVTNNFNNDQLSVRNTSDLGYQVISGQSDLFLSLEKFNFEAGLKFTRFKNDSDIEYFNVIESVYVIDPNQSNEFGLREDNFAAYVSLYKPFGKYLTLKAGLRYEYTDLLSSASAVSSSYHSQYGKFFPNFNLMYKKGNNSFTVNYNKRINRPRLGQLNPFRWYSNPFVYMEGNPYLQPTVSHNAELNYLYKNMFMASVFGTQQNDAYGALIRIQDGVKETKTQNVYSIRNYGINLSYYSDILPFWNLSINASAYYSESSSKYQDIAAFNGLSANYSLNNSLLLKKKNAWWLYVNFAHSLPGKESNVITKNVSNLTLGTKFNVFANKITVNIRASDVLKGTVSKGSLSYQTFNQAYNNYYDNQNFSVSFSYNFGTNKNQFRNTQFSEQYRAN